ncbi:MAG: hypothetical protein EOM24_10305, partial [Chloroflexia bacterium]|nr:hypothetical protein [Chloroflexia bacterium]
MMKANKLKWISVVSLVMVAAFLLTTNVRSNPQQIHAGPAAIINLCTLPDSRIDVNDLAYEGEDILVNGCQGEINGSHTFNSLTVQTGSTLIHSHALTMSLTINTNVLIESGSSLNLTGLGYAGGTAGYDPGDGPGGGQIGDGTGGGGGHGGFGGFQGILFAQAGEAYGDPYRPTTLGSGGASCAANSFCSAPGGNGGAGGGAIHLD